MQLPPAPLIYWIEPAFFQYRIRGWKNWAARLSVYLGILVAIRWLLWRFAAVTP